VWNRLCPRAISIAHPQSIATEAYSHSAAHGATPRPEASVARPCPASYEVGLCRLGEVDVLARSSPAPRQAPVAEQGRRFRRQNRRLLTLPEHGRRPQMRRAPRLSASVGSVQTDGPVGSACLEAKRTRLSSKRFDSGSEGLKTEFPKPISKPISKPKREKVEG